MLPLSPKSAALDRVVERLSAGDPPEAIVAATLQVASLRGAADDPSVQRAAATLASLARDHGDPRAALRVLGANPVRPSTRLSLVAAIAEALDRESTSPIGQLAVLSAIEALVAAPEPLAPEHGPQLFREWLARLFERWLFAQLGRHLDEPMRLALSTRVRAAARALGHVDAVEPALAALEGALAR